MNELDKELHELLIWKLGASNGRAEKWITDGLYYYYKKYLEEKKMKEEVIASLKAKGWVFNEVFFA